MSTKVLKDASVPDDLKKQLKRLTTGTQGMMWYRLEYDKTINAVLMYKSEKLVGWALIDKPCCTDVERVDVHVFVHKNHRGKGYGTSLREKCKKPFEKIFKKWYYWNYKEKNYLRF